MKSRIVTLLTAMTLFAALVITVTAQQSPTNDAKYPGDAQACIKKLRKKLIYSARSSPQALKREHIFDDLRNE